MDGNPESERVAVGEAPAHDEAGGVMERIGGRGSDPAQLLLQSARAFLSSVFLLVDLVYIYVSRNLPYASCFMNTYRSARLILS